MLKHTERLAGRFYCISQYKDINKKEGRKQTSLAKKSVHSKNHAVIFLNAQREMQTMLQNLEHFRLIIIKNGYILKYIYNTLLTEYSLMHTIHC